MSTTVVSTDPQLLPRDLNVTYPAEEGQTDADWSRVGRHTLSYSGPYRVTRSEKKKKVKKGIVMHGPLRVAHVPGLNGTEQERNFTLVETAKGKRYLEIVQESEGVKSVLWWEQIGRA